MRRHSGSYVRRIKVGAFEIDVAKRQVKLKDSHVELTPIEVRILTRLVEVAPRPVPAEALVGCLSAQPAAGDTRSVRVHVSSLKAKLTELVALAEAPATAAGIVSERGLGYVFRGEELERRRGVGG